jgi:hypothetical protein
MRRDRRTATASANPVGAGRLRWCTTAFTVRSQFVRSSLIAARRPPGDRRWRFAAVAASPSPRSSPFMPERRSPDGPHGRNAGMERNGTPARNTAWNGSTLTAIGPAHSTGPRTPEAASAARLGGYRAPRSPGAPGHAGPRSRPGRVSDSWSWGMNRRSSWPTMNRSCRWRWTATRWSTELEGQSHAARSASLPSGSASVHQSGPRSRTSRPPAASPAATRACTWSRGT